MTKSVYRTTLTLDYTIDEVQKLVGPQSIALRQLEEEFSITIYDRGQRLLLEGEASAVEAAKLRIEQRLDPSKAKSNDATLKTSIVSSRFQITAKNQNQSQMIKHLQTRSVNFFIGPAGTGKTFIATSYGLKMLFENQVERLVITRPIVEAGEKLGFLPGDIAQKVDPYLKPIYDSLYDLVGTQTTQKLIDNNTIEITPFAYMRGRTFKNTYIIADECQNTTPQQMKMLLTRLGHGSFLTITGDPSQVDLPQHQSNGLFDAQKKLKAIEPIGFSYLQSSDSVRHPLVKTIIDAYDNPNH